MGRGTFTVVVPDYPKIFTSRKAGQFPHWVQGISILSWVDAATRTRKSNPAYPCMAGSNQSIQTPRVSILTWLFPHKKPDTLSFASVSISISISISLSPWLAISFNQSDKFKNQGQNGYDNPAL